MQEIDVEAVLREMLGKAAKEFADGWSTVQVHVTETFDRLTKTSAKIVKYWIDQEVEDHEALAMLAGIRAAARDTLLTIRDVAKITVIKAWNAAIAVLHAAIERATDTIIPV